MNADAPVAPSQDNAQRRWPAIAHGLLIACAGLLLIAQCWDAPFLSYDDTAHVASASRRFEDISWSELMDLHACMPVALLSYRIDYAILGQRLTATNNGNWAPIVRIMNWLYHTLAALILWRLLLLIGAGPWPSFLIALIFAIHPMSCETVAWISERKNALAALFGFASLYSFLSLKGRIWRAPVTFVLFGLAAFSKQSALGFLPLFPVLELFGGDAGLRGERPLNLRPNSSWVSAGLCILPLVCISGVVAWMTVSGINELLIAPPGGTPYTALLTDSEILVRYLAAIIAPAGLSIAYSVDPIVSILDLRFIGCAALLAAIVFATIRLARSPRRAAFGWCLFFAGLLVNLNIVALYYPMQDRYVYLSMPGFLLALTEMALGIAGRLKLSTPALLRSCAAAYVVALGAMSFSRSAVFRNSFLLFHDAADKQPKSSWAHYGLMQAYFQEWSDLSKSPGDPDKLREMRLLAEEQRRIFVDECPDATRNFIYTQMALEAGEFRYGIGQYRDAERYFRLAAFPAPGVQNTLSTQAKAFRGLALLHLQAHSPGQNAFRFAQAALETGDAPEQSLLIRARAAIAWAKESDAGAASRSAQLRAQAKADLEAIPKGSPLYDDARKLLKDAGLE